jgi:serine phosphatase RsbU (regulator of sigma subunit)
MKRLLYRFLCSIFFALFAFTVVHAQETISLETGNLNVSIAKKAVILEDAEHNIRIKQALNDASLKFEAIDQNVKNLDFTTSRYWIKFKLKNNSADKVFFLETARPITNKAVLYEVENGTVVRTQKSGDDFPFKDKKYKHRKNIFQINLEYEAEREFLLMLESDGEMLTLPLIFWQPDALAEHVYHDQLKLGLYFGILLFVFLIYFFFFIVMKDISFFYYIFYVFFLGILQFSIEGLSFQYFFSGGGYLANHIIVISAGLAVIFLMLYARQFLKTFDILPKFDKVYKVLIGLEALVTLMGFFTGGIYELVFPLINGLSFLSFIFVLVTIFVAKSRKHHVDPFFTAAFISVIVGAFSFILGNFGVIAHDLGEAGLKIFSALEVIFLSFSMANRYRELQKAKEEAQKQALHQLEEKNKLAAEINVRLEKQVAERTAEVVEQKEELEEKNKEIMASIKYAERIQEAILPPVEQVEEILINSFILYKPRDIVSGDFYWVEQTVNNSGQKFSLFAAADCTGHGVPGAFMSIVGNNYLKLSLTQNEVNTPAEALDFLNKGVNDTLRQKIEESTVRDGMDISLCAIERSNNKLYYAGAKNPVYIVSKRPQLATDKETYEPNIASEDETLNLFEIKGDKHPIGAYEGEVLYPFTNHEIQLEKGDVVYTFSDGYADQFGGTRGKKFMYKKFKRLLLSICDKPMNEQQEVLEQRMAEWMGDNYEQIDDILVIGVRIP